MTDQRQGELNRASWLVGGAVGGILAGAVFLAATMWFATSVGDPVKGPLLMISSIVKGDDAMMTGSASVGVGLVVHLGLSALFGVVFALLAPRLKSNGALAVAGTLYGAALYLINFKILSPIAFPVFQMANQPFELVVHVVFGTLLALTLFTVPSLAGARSASRAERLAVPTPAQARAR